MGKAEEVNERAHISEMTTKLLEESLGKTVLVRLRGGKKLWGKLKGFDQHINLLLEETEGITNAKKARKLGAIILRGAMLLVLHLGENMGKTSKVLV